MELPAAGQPQVDRIAEAVDVDAGPTVDRAQQGHRAVGGRPAMIGGDPVEPGFDIAARDSVQGTGEPVAEVAAWAASSCSASSSRCALIAVASWRVSKQAADGGESDAVHDPLGGVGMSEVVEAEAWKACILAQAAPERLESRTVRVSGNTRPTSSRRGSAASSRAASCPNQIVRGPVLVSVSRAPAPAEVGHRAVPPAVGEDEGTRAGRAVEDVAGGWRELDRLGSTPARRVSSRFRTSSLKHQGSALVSDGIGNHDAARVAVGGRIQVTVLEIP